MPTITDNSINEAINSLDKLLSLLPRADFNKYGAGIKLGKEALKIIKEFRTGHYKTINSPLLGETNQSNSQNKIKGG